MDGIVDVACSFVGCNQGIARYMDIEERGVFEVGSDGDAFLSRRDIAYFDVLSCIDFGYFAGDIEGAHSGVRHHFEACFTRGVDAGNDDFFAAPEAGSQR